ncbi:hypothetical protein VNI00_002605 [Paramarasmius palmivorus]|uniref:Methyltransferase domain-containing protein n=1 Tax=Paramarasmius palmivorus TaxID=297713 RepID=A0AAW0DZD3_9AGAR
MSVAISPNTDVRSRPPKRPVLTRSQSDSNPSFIRSSSVQDSPNSKSPPLPSSSFLQSDPNPKTHDRDSQIPNRPPRNPARSGPDLPVSIQIVSPTPVRPARKLTIKSGRPKTATGTREEVTPWELHPPPESYGKDAPKSTGGSGVGQPSNLKRNVTVSVSGRPLSPVISFGDLSILRRRKTTGSKVQKSKSSGSHVLQKPRAVSGGNPIPPVSQHNDHLTRSSDVKAASSATSRVLQKPDAGHKVGSSQPESFFYHKTRGLPIPITTSSSQGSPSTSHATPTPATNSTLHKSPSQTSSSDHHQNLKFSTADRTILEELKRNIQARASQFVMKGGHSGQPMQGLSPSNMVVPSTLSMGRLGGIGGVRRHHAYSKKQAPYPRSYERGVLDLDVWETLFCQQISGSLTWHDFKTPPTKVLDIGCGTGSWILDCARTWKNCHFVGLDLVPLHPDLIQVGSVDMAQRITWVQDNFLDGLPFPNEEFDFVHIKRIALGVPEDKWDFLFEEIIRVMKPGGAFEMIEEDLFFPGRPVGSDTDDESIFTTRSRDSSQQAPFRRSSIKRNSVQSSGQRSSGIPLDSDFGSDLEHDLDSDSLLTSSGGSHHTSSTGGKLSSEDMGSLSASSATSTGPGLLFTPAGGNKSQVLSASPRSTSPLPLVPMMGREVGAIVEDEEGERRADLPTPEEILHDRFATNETITQASAAKMARSDVQNSPATGQLKTTVINHNTGGASKPVLPPLHTRSATTTVPSPYHNSNPSASPQYSSKSLSQPRHSSSTSQLQSPLTLSSATDISPVARRSSDTSSRPKRLSGNSKSSTTSPFLLRTLPKPPTNPRDHSLLEHIYHETAASRFINLAPLSLLPNLLNVHFKDVRTHPPLQFTFPPRIDSPRHQGESDIRQAEDPDEEAQDAVSPAPATTWTPRARRHSVTATPHQRFVFPASSNEPFRSLENLHGDEDYDNDHFVSIKTLIQGASPYVSLDDSRPSAFSPSSRASFFKAPSPKALSMPPQDVQTNSESLNSPTSPKLSPFAIATSASMLKNRLPNQTLNMDLRSLNLHLLARVSEIMACSESMWEWLVEYQEKAHHAKTVKAQRARSKSIDAAQPAPAHRPAAENEEDKLAAALLELTREDFEELLQRFYLDMQDHVEIDLALEKRFDWKTFKSAEPIAERKAFDEAWDKYVKWMEEQQRRPPPPPKPRKRPLSASFAYPSHSFSYSVDGLPGVIDSVGRLPIPSASSNHSIIRGPDPRLMHEN